MVFDNCVYPCENHACKELGCLLHPRKFPHAPFQFIPTTPAHLRQSLFGFCHHKLAFPCSRIQIHGITCHVLSHSDTRNCMPCALAFRYTGLHTMCSCVQIHRIACHVLSRSDTRNYMPCALCVWPLAHGNVSEIHLCCMGQSFIPFLG